MLNSSMTEFFKKNDSVRARPDYLADSINPLPLGKSDMRRDRPSCNGVPNKQMLRTRHHVFEHRNLLPHVSRVIETFPQLAPALFGLLEGALRTHGGYLLTCRLGLLTRMPPCLGKHVEWDCRTARQCRLSRFIAR